MRRTSPNATADMRVYASRECTEAMSRRRPCHGSPAGRTDGIEWFGWVLALIGALICMTGCELYKCYVKHYAPPPI